MFVFFGTKNREEPRGIVAESCPRCGGARPFKVFDVYNTWHVYYISLGRGTRQPSVMRCVDCGAELSVAHERYAEIVPVGEARALPWEELVRRSHPALLERPCAPGDASLPETGGATVRCRSCGQVREARFSYCPACGAPAR